MLHEEQKGKLEAALNLFTVKNTVSKNIASLAKAKQDCKSSYSFLAL